MLPPGQKGILIGLTGGIACGKSTAAKMFESCGFEILDTDLITHQSLKSGGACYENVLKLFGPDIQGPDGEIDRAALGRIVFRDESKRKILEGILHPVVRAAWRDWADQVRHREGRGCVVIPLLFEVGAVHGWNAIVCVSASENTVLQRLLDRGLTEKEAKDRISAQWPVSEKEIRSDFVIRNDGTVESLKKEIENISKQLLQQGGTHG